MSRRTLAVDFDGTITERDTLIAIEEQFGDPAGIERIDGLFDEGKLTLREEIEGKFAHVHAPFEEVRDWVVRTTRFRPGFPELVERARADGWRVVVVSSGFEELIRPLLEREGVDVELLANGVQADAGGWRVDWRYPGTCEVCGESCKRGRVLELAAGGELAYAGDGYSDRCAARAAGRVFATRGLARYLDEHGVEYVPFGDFHEVAAAL